MSELKALPGYALVEIRSKYSHVVTTEQKYDVKVSGILLDFFPSMGHKDTETVAILDVIYGKLSGKLVFWNTYQEGEAIERDGKQYCYVKLDDLQGYEDV